MLYETVVIEKPTVKDEEKGELERVISGPHLITAANEEQARVQTLLEHKIPEGVVKRRVEVLVRSFVDAS